MDPKELDRMNDKALDRFEATLQEPEDNEDEYENYINAGIDEDVALDERDGFND